MDRESGKIWAWSMAMRWAAWALEAAFSPLTGAIWQAYESSVGDKEKEAISELVTPAITSLKWWYDNQSPEQQENLKDIWASLEVLTSFLGWWSGKKVLESVWDVGVKIWERAVETGVKIAEKTAPLVEKTWELASIAGTKTVEGGKTIWKSLISQQTWIWTEWIESILKNPELQWKIRSGEISASKNLEEAKWAVEQVYKDLWETWKQYDTVRNATVEVPKAEARDVVMTHLGEEGLVDGSKLNLIDLPIKDRGAIEQALKYVDEYKDTLNAKNLLSLRQKLDDLVNWKSDVWTNGERIVKGIRAKIDEYAWEKLPWLKEIDAEYAPEKQFFGQIRRDIYNKDGSLKDNALSIVSNLTNKGNEARLARMEQIIPGIWERVKALKAFEDVKAASSIKVGTYARAATTWAIAFASIPAALAVWVATHPAVVARVLEGVGYWTRAVKRILNKGKNIAPKDAEVIIDAVKKIKTSQVENIINNLSYDPKTSKLTSGSIWSKLTAKERIVESREKPAKVEEKVATPKGEAKKDKIQEILDKSWKEQKELLEKPKGKTTAKERLVESRREKVTNKKNDKPKVSNSESKSPAQTTTNLSKSKGGFLRLPEIGKKNIPKELAPLAEEAKLSQYERYKDSIMKSQRTENWIISKLFADQKLRTKRDGLPDIAYTKEELTNFVRKNEKYRDMYDTWVKSWYDSSLKPSIDRINPKKWYSLDNIQLITWWENKLKWHAEMNITQGKPVVQIDSDGKVVKIHKSLIDASKDTGISFKTISNVALWRPERKTAWWYSWRYAREDELPPDLYNQVHFKK